MTQNRKEKEASPSTKTVAIQYLYLIIRFRFDCSEVMSVDDNSGLMTGAVALSTQTCKLVRLVNTCRRLGCCYKIGSTKQSLLLFFTILTMPQPTTVTQCRPDSKSPSIHANTTATEPQPQISIFTFPPEVRLAIYSFTFTTSENCTLRRLKDVPPRRHFSQQAATLFPSSILQTSKTIHTEALPIFHASQTFHYSTELHGLFGQPTIPNAHLGWLKHMSIDVTVATNTLKKLDSIIAIHTQAILKHCSKLSSFTLHIIPAAEPGHFNVTDHTMAQAETHLLKGGSAKLLKTLQQRIEELSIVYYGNWHTLRKLRKAIAGDKDWVQGDNCYGWPALSLTEAQDEAVSVKQRRYTEVGSEGVVHPHKKCIRAFHCCRAGDV